MARRGKSECGSDASGKKGGGTNGGGDAEDGAENVVRGGCVAERVRLERGVGVLEERADLADLELEVMDERVIFARQQRNKTIGACRLPPEVLSTIFAHAQDGWMPRLESIDCTEVDGKSQDIRTSYSLGWMLLLHVCSFWRQVRGIAFSDVQ